MVDFAGFSSGYRKGQDNLRRRRSELSRAFEEFKRNNPTASYQEFQDFIDLNVGDGLGSNYVRGGAPSNEVLRKLEGEGQRRQRVQAAQDAARMWQERQQALTDMDQLSNRLLVENDFDPDAAFEQFSQIVGEDSVDFLGPEFKPRGLFSPSRADHLRRGMMEEKLPLALQLIEATDGNIDTTRLGQQLGIPMSIAEPVKQHALQTYGEKKEQEALERERQQVNLRNQVQDSIESNPLVANFIKNGQPEKAKEIMLEIAKSRLHPSDFEVAYGTTPEQAGIDLFNDYYDLRLSAERELHQNEYESAAQRGRAAAAQQFQLLREENLEAAAALREALGNDPELSEENLAYVGLAVSQLARRYTFDQATMDAIRQVVVAAPDDVRTNSVALIQEVEASPEFQAATNGRTLSDAQSQLEDRFVTQEVGASRPMTFDAFLDEHKSQNTHYAETVSRKLGDIARIEDPAERVMKLNSMAQQVTKDLQLGLQSLDAQVQNRAWLIPGGQTAFSEEAVYGDQADSLVKAAIATAEDVYNQIQTELLEAEVERAENEARARAEQAREADKLSYQGPAPRPRATPSITPAAQDALINNIP